MLCSRCRKNWITRTKKNGRLFLNCDQCLKYERDRRATCQRVYVGALPNHMLDARLGIERDREDIDGIPAITPAQASIAWNDDFDGLYFPQQHGIFGRLRWRRHRFV